MVASDEAFLKVAADIVLQHRGPAEFPAPDHQCLVEQAPLFKICQQSSDRAIHLLALDGEGLVDALAR